MIAATGARCSRTSTPRRAIPGMDRGLRAGDVIKVGKTVELECPRHARPHHEPRLPAVAHRQPALFCGDTLFNAGAGNCHNGGHPDQLYDTFAATSSRSCPTDTRVYPGHDYITNNLRFTLDREPDNEGPQLLAEVEADQDPDARRGLDPGAREGDQHVLAADQPDVIARLRERFPTCRTSRRRRRCSSSYASCATTGSSRSSLPP
jgi:hydroxyacylglutathione hydrolase